MTKNTKKSKSRTKNHQSKSKQINKIKSQESRSEEHHLKVKKSNKKIVQEIEHKQELISSSSPALKSQFKMEVGVITVKLHQTYTLLEKHPLYKSIESLYVLYVQKQSLRQKKVHTQIPITYFPLFQFVLRGQKPSDDKCSICQFQYNQPQDYEQDLLRSSDEDIVSLQCSHLLHKSCFLSLKGNKDWIKCPVCSTIFGVMIGDQPPGNMTWNVNSFIHCDSFEDVGTITIDYSMHAGKRGNINFPGTHRTAYLPDNQGGNQVLQLLKKAFDRKLIFTVGRSVTTGQDNRIVWNGVHHKTNTSGGSAYFGYPDETYFDRVKLELAAKGVV